MKLPESTHFVESSSNMTEKYFSLDSENQGLIFEILRSKLYSDPIGSICREISSNCRDAHRETDKTDVPCEIGWDSQGNIYFKDFGPGISPERMENIFIKYAASTKRDTNYYTGGWGLGCKTPFAYSDTFCISTVHDKIKYNYMAVIDETKTGKLISLGSEPSEEENNTVISIPVKRDDVNNFENKIIRFTQFWLVRPELINFTQTYSDKDFSFDREGEFFVRYTTSYAENVYILIDSIPYKLDATTDLIESSSKYHDIFLRFDSGELSVSANRETVYLDDKTKTAIKEKYKQFDKFVVDNLLSDVNSCETIFQLHTLIWKIRRNKSKANDRIRFYHFYLDYIRGKNFNFDWKDQHFVLNEETLAAVSYSCQHIDNVVTSKLLTDIFYIDVEKAIFYVKDTTLSKERLLTLSNQQTQYVQEGSGKNIYIFTKYPKHKEGIDKIVNLYGLNCQKLSEVKRTVIKQKIDKTDHISCKEYSGGRFYPKIIFPSSKEFNLSYFETEKVSISDEECETIVLWNAVFRKPVLAAPKKRIDLLRKIDNLLAKEAINFDFIPQTVINTHIHNDIDNQLSEITDSSVFDIIDFFRKKDVNLSAKFKCSETLRICYMIENVKKHDNNIRGYHLSLLVKRYPKKFEYSKIDISLVKQEIKEIENRKPMIKHIRFDKHDEIMIKDLTTYINS